jgi:hypothetical protein
VERDKPTKSESVGQNFAAVAIETKKGGLKKIGFLSSNFMNLFKNIHGSVWQLLGVETIQNGDRCHGNQGAKNVKFKPYSGSF